MKFSLPCVIFAGGKSSRMGEDKALLPFGNCKTLAEYQYKRMLTIFDMVYMSTKSNKFPFKAPLLFDNSNDFAPTYALISIFSQLEDKALFVISVDTPFVDKNVINQILQTYEKNSYDCDAVVAKSPNGVHPLCGVYTKKVVPKLNSMINKNNHKLNLLLKESKTYFVHFEEDSPFFNINHPEDYKAAINMA